MKAPLFIMIAMLLATGLALYIAKKNLSQPTQNSLNGITNILEQRHSGYSFDPNKKVSQDNITSLIKAAQLTPSSYNEQPWNFIICDKSTSLDAYTKTLSSLAEANQKWAKDAQLLVVVTTSKNSVINNEPNPWAEYDTGAAALSMSIQATALGLMTHQMAGFDRAKITEFLALPTNVIPMSIIAIGYEDLTRSKAQPRQRKQTHENFFQGAWGRTNSNWK